MAVNTTVQYGSGHEFAVWKYTQLFSMPAFTTGQYTDTELHNQNKNKVLPLSQLTVLQYSSYVFS
jgi:hypothetical protein